MVDTTETRSSETDVSVARFPTDDLEFLRKRAKREGVQTDPSDAATIRWAAIQYARSLELQDAKRATA